MKLNIPVFPKVAPPGRVHLGPPEIVQELGRAGVCVLTRDGLILTEGEARFRAKARRGERLIPRGR